MFVVVFMPSWQETMCSHSVLQPQHRRRLFAIGSLALCYRDGTFVVSFALLQLVGSTGVTAHSLCKYVLTQK